MCPRRRWRHPLYCVHTPLLLKHRRQLTNCFESREKNDKFITFCGQVRHAGDDVNVLGLGCMPFRPSLVRGGSTRLLEVIVPSSRVFSSAGRKTDLSPRFLQKYTGNLVLNLSSVRALENWPHRASEPTGVQQVQPGWGGGVAIMWLAHALCLRTHGVPASAQNGQTIKRPRPDSVERRRNIPSELQQQQRHGGAARRRCTLHAARGDAARGGDRGFHGLGPACAWSGPTRPG